MRNRDECGMDRMRQGIPRGFTTARQPPATARTVPAVSIWAERGRVGNGTLRRSAPLVGTSAPVRCARHQRRPSAPAQDRARLGAPSPTRRCPTCRIRWARLTDVGVASVHGCSLSERRQATRAAILYIIVRRFVEGEAVTPLVGDIQATVDKLEGVGERAPDSDLG